MRGFHYVGGFPALLEGGIVNRTLEKYQRKKPRRLF
jgi:hypothetical protein